MLNPSSAGITLIIVFRAAKGKGLYEFRTFETVGRPFRVLGPKITEGAFELQGPVGPDGVVS
jgi:hypothetical protein